MCKAGAGGVRGGGWLKEDWAMEEEHYITGEQATFTWAGEPFNQVTLSVVMRQ